LNNIANKNNEIEFDQKDKFKVSMKLFSTLYSEGL